MRTVKGRRKKETKGVPREEACVVKIDDGEEYCCLTNHQPSSRGTNNNCFVSEKSKNINILGINIKTIYNANLVM